MVKTISRIGNSQGLIFDAALMDLAHLKAGDQVRVEVHEGGAITLTPLRSRPTRAEVSRVIKATVKDYAKTMKKLAFLWSCGSTASSPQPTGRGGTS